MAGPAVKSLIAALEAKLTPLGPFHARPMFGGHGLYIDGMIFGLLASEHVYLKVDERSRGAFEAAGSAPFRYETSRGETTITSYWRCPDNVLGDAKKLRAWVTNALAASRQARQKKPERKKVIGKPSRQRNPFQ
jgi:DNA transformation protein